MSINKTALLGQEVLAGNPSYRDIVLYPYCSNVAINAEGEIESKLSVFTEMNTDAVIELQKAHPNASVIIPGESPFGDYKNTTDLAAERLLDGGVPENALVRLYRTKKGRGLDNTYLQAKGLKEYYGERDGDDILFSTLDYHSRRVRNAIGAFGLRASFTTAESVFAAQNIEKYEPYADIINGLKPTEVLARMMTSLVCLPKGQIPNYLMLRSGPRIVDIAQLPDGTLVLEKDFANAKVARLKAEAAVKRQA